MGELYSIETRPSPTLAFDTVTQRAMALEQLLARSCIRASGVRLDRGRWRHRHCGTWRSEKRDEHDKRSGPHSRRHKHLAVSFRQIHAKRRANNKCCQPYRRYQSRARRRYCPRMKTRRFRACGRQYGSCPETGFAEGLGSLGKRRYSTSPKPTSGQRRSPQSSVASALP